MTRHQRDRVLTAAAEIVAKRGYNSTTVDHIVSAAGIGVGTFYELFGNKEDCFLQAYERVIAEGRERIAAAVPPDRPWAEQVYAALGAVLTTIASRPLDARLALVEVQTAGPAALARHEQTLDALVPALRAGRRSSPLASELPAMLETAISGGVVWLLQQRIAEGQVDDIEPLLPELARIVIEPYFGEAEAERLIAAARAAAPVAG
jgi:AcrR family transcriptional regulator